MRIAFMGTPSFAVPALEVLLETPGEVVAVYTQPDRPKGRGLAVVESPVKARARAAGADVRQPATLKDDAVYAAFAGLELDLCVVAAYGRILPKRFLDAPRLGCVNVHASLLPKYRGAAPIQWAIARGETETGVTLMQMDVGMDTGDMLLRRAISIADDDTGGTLEPKLSRLGAALLREGLAELRRGTLARTPQDHAQATLAPMLTKEHGRIDWTRPARELVNLVRAMNPWPTAHTGHAGNVLRVFAAEAAPAMHSAPPGTVTLVSRTSGGRLEVACGDEVVALLELQAEGRKRLPVGAFLAGYRIAERDVLGM
jgi:methionyl-tRNA formyltransferase